jgi:tagatose-1,6-bisphosphate aldolase
MLAMDQRGSLAKMIDPDAPDAVPYKDVIAVKRDVIGVLSPLASAVLLDVETGYGACVASGALSGQAGLLLALEQSGYTGDPFARQTALLDDWSVEQTRRAGASGVKLLVYYRPDAPNAADQEALVAQVAAECRRWDLPLFLEPLHYSLDPKVKTVPSAERRTIVIETARRLVALGVTVLKAEFPLDVKQNSNQTEWAAACEELSAACAAPWVLLSAGVDFDTYVDQVRVACRAGASGILCGRAVWKESVQLPGEERRAFLEIVGRERFDRLAETVDAAARPFTDFYAAGTGEDLENWYR